MLSKNFPATHQLDADFCTGFLDTGRWGPGRHGDLFTKQAFFDTEPQDKPRHH